MIVLLFTTTKAQETGENYHHTGGNLKIFRGAEIWYLADGMFLMRGILLFLTLFKNLLKLCYGLKIFRTTCGTLYLNQPLKGKTSTLNTCHLKIDSLRFEFFVATSA